MYSDSPISLHLPEAYPRVEEAQICGVVWAVKEMEAGWSSSWQTEYGLVRYLILNL